MDFSPVELDDDTLGFWRECRDGVRVPEDGAHPAEIREEPAGVGRA
ncbi:MAG TPA: hypothetical protein VHC18_28640 [Amycolatopsis sp.]|nr:hypothetical protein [Amycolatopsis sp.]